MLFNEPKLLKCANSAALVRIINVSVLFNEPKLLKLLRYEDGIVIYFGFSALQRAEIAEIARGFVGVREYYDVSVLFNEPKLLKSLRRMNA